MQTNFHLHWSQIDHSKNLLSLVRVGWPPQTIACRLHETSQIHRASCTGLLLRQGLHRDAAPVLRLHRDAAPVLPGRAMRSIIHNAAFSMQQKNRSEKRAHFRLPVCSLSVLPHSGWASHLQRVLHAPTIWATDFAAASSEVPARAANESAVEIKWSSGSYTGSPGSVESAEYLAWWW